MKPTIIEDEIFEFEPFEKDDVNFFRTFIRRYIK
jgi:hypothetical protein